MSEPTTTERPFVMQQVHYNFCHNVVKCASIREAIAASGLSEGYVYGKLLKQPAIQTYLAELRKRIEDETVLSILQRKQLLSNIAKGEVANHSTRTTIIEGVPQTTVEASTRVADQIAATKELNRIDGIGQAEGTTVSIDNRSQKLIVIRSSKDGLNREDLACLIEGTNAQAAGGEGLPCEETDVEGGSPLREDSLQC